MPTFSVFTPTHDPAGLAAAYRSLLGQSEADWEWVLVPNRGGTIPPEIAGDPRVVVRPAAHTGGIGHLKKLACAAASGRVLVELDHDDRLLEGALAAVGDAIAGGAGFVYSDWIEVDAGGKNAPDYAEGCGWDYYPFEFEGATYRARSAFDPTPASLRAITTAPNHVRAITRDAYAQVGGHDESLRIGDDHDLVCRAYLAGVPFRHVATPLYLYRVSSGVDRNTSTREVESLVAVRSALTERYTYPLLDEWCRRESLLRVDLGARFDKPDGYVGVDRDAGPGVDVVADLRHGLPFATDSVGRLRAHDFLEHLPPGDTIVRLWNEIYRVLAPGGWFTSLTPSSEGRAAWQAPDHVSAWNANSFWYVTRRAQQQYVRGLHAKFQAIQVQDFYPSPQHAEHKVAYVRADLVALKGQRQPGFVFI